jgi:hypothetical protein
MRNFEIQKKNSGSFRGLGISLLFFFICFLFPIFTHASGITKAPNNLGLVGYWSMNEGSGTVSSDFSGNKNNGVFGGTPTWVNGKFGKGLNFFNLGNYIQVSDSNSLDTTSDVTVSAWIKLNGNSDTQFVVNKDENYSLRVTGGLVRMQFWTGTTIRAVDVTAPSSGSWHHVVGVVTSNEVTAVYVDGILQGSSAYVLSGGVSRVLTNPLIFGTGFGGGYAGSIDEVRIYNRALSQSEVSTLYKGGVVVKRQANNLGLVGYWPMNEGDGTVAGDSSGFGNTGIFANNTTWDTGKVGKAVSFRGGAFFDHIHIYSPASTNIKDNSLTISVWIKKTTNGGIVAGQGYTLELGDAGVGCGSTDIAFIKKFYGIYCMSSFPVDGEWHLLTIVADSGGITSYVDAVVTDTAGDGTVFPDQSGNDITLGSGVGSTQFGGSLDEMRIYDRALSSDEIAALYKTTYSLVNRTPTTVVSSGLVGYWPMDGKYVEWETGVVDDVSENGNDGQVVNMSTTTSPVVGKVGQALRFDGVDDAIDVGSAINLANSSFTVSAWAKRGAVTPVISEFFLSQGSASPYNMLQLGIDDNQPFCGFYSDDLYVLGTSILDTQWHHYVCTYNASTNERIVYMDGVEIDRDTTSGDFAGTGTFYIGRQTALPVTYKGSIDEVKVYNRALSPAEILTLYNATK